MRLEHRWNRFPSWLQRSPWLPVSRILSRQIKSSIDKPGKNQKRLQSLTDEIINGLVDLQSSYQSCQDVLDGSEELLIALEGLRTEMHELLERCLHTSGANDSGGRIAVAKAKFKAWKRRNDIENDIVHLKERVQACHVRFQTRASVRIERSLIVLTGRTEVQLALNNEQQVGLTRIESTITRRFVNQDLGRTSGHRTAGDLDDRDIARQYLRIQVRKIVNSLKDLAVTRSFAAEEPKGSHLMPPKFSIAYIPQTEDPTDEHDEVVATALQILRRLRNDHEKLSIQEGGLDVLLLSCSLDSLEMWEDAEITCTWAANLYRTLVQGNPRAFLPYLAICLINLPVIRINLCDYGGALAVSEEAVEVHRKLHEMQLPDSAEDLAVVLGNHALALNLGNYWTESLTTAEESVELFRKQASQEVELCDQVIYDDSELLCVTISLSDSDSESEETDSYDAERPGARCAV